MTSAGLITATTEELPLGPGPAPTSPGQRQGRLQVASRLLDPGQQLVRLPCVNGETLPMRLWIASRQSDRASSRLPGGTRPRPAGCRPPPHGRLGSRLSPSPAPPSRPLTPSAECAEACRREECEGRPRLARQQQTGERQDDEASGGDVQPEWYLPRFQAFPSAHGWFRAGSAIGLSLAHPGAGVQEQRSRRGDSNSRPHHYE
jgi:hypothetical protein